MRTLIAALALVAAAASLFAQTVPTQVTASTAPGYVPYSTYGGVQESINLENGGLHLSVPLLSLPGRNGHDLQIALNYDSKIWELEYDPGDEFTSPYYYWTMLDSAGWQLNLPFLDATWNPNGNGGNGCFNAAIFRDSDGTNHPLGVYLPGGCNTGSDAVDSSFYHIDASNPSDIIVSDKRGTRYHFPGFGNWVTKIENTNGNLITFSYAQPNTVQITDTVGRTITVPTYLGGNGSFTYTDSNNQPQTISWTVAALPANCSIINPAGSGAGSIPGAWINSITLPGVPNPVQYSFQFSSCGELTKITYPTGGYARYDYGTFTNLYATPSLTQGFPVAADFRELTAKHICRDKNGSCTTGTEDTTTYTPTVNNTLTSNQYMDELDPLGNKTRHYFSTMPGGGGGITYSPRELTRWIYSGTSTLLRTISTDYNNLSSGNTTPSSLPIRQTTTLNDVTPNLVSKVEWDYNSAVQNADLASMKREYDWGSGAVGALVRRTEYTWLKTNSVNGQDYSSAAIHILDRQATVAIYDANSNLIAQSQLEYDNYTAGLTSTTATQHQARSIPRGNLTATKKWLNPGNSWLTTRNQFDDTGNILSTTDPGGHTVSFVYSSANQFAYLTQITLPQTNSINHISSTTYDLATGLKLTSTDENNQQTSFAYDKTKRLTSVTFPNTDGGGNHGQTTYSYNDVVGSLSITTQKRLDATRWATSVALFDGIGNQVQTQVTSDPEGTDYVDTTYDALGRVSTISNPYRSTTESTYGVTTHNYDALGREVKLIPPDGTSTTNNIVTTFAGNCSTVTDQASKSRKTCTDGLGRLTQVFENPGGLNFETDYQYDVLDNLLRVDQKGSAPGDSTQWRTRTFTYNSLSQLLTTTNPELGYDPSIPGRITYTYDADGNVLTKVAPAPNQIGSATVTTTYTYDALHRLLTKTYSDGTTLQTNFYYDAATWGTPQTNIIGRLTETWTGPTCCSVGGAQTFGYDPVGRVVMNNQCDPDYCVANGIPFTYNYDLAGDMTSYTSGVGVTTSQTFDAVGRPTQVTSSMVDPQHPGTLVTVDSTNGYTAAGALRKITFANGLTETAVYNSRLQPCRGNVNSSGTLLNFCGDPLPGNNVQDFKYGFNFGSSNNGNLASMLATGTAPGTQNFNRTYTYDALNRLLTMSAPGDGCSGLSWTYDAWANRSDQTVTGGSCGTFHNLPDTRNRLTGTPYSYDAAGNLTHDSNHSYTYDAEGRIVSVDGGSTARYLYDGMGHRTSKMLGTAFTDYGYDLAGNVITEWKNACTGGQTCWATGYIYLGGHFVAEYSAGTTYFIHRDHLGSTRLMTKLDGTVLDSLDYLPYGEQISGDTSTTHKFTSKERDSETSLDDFGARYYGSTLGRFVSADWSAVPEPVPYADLSDPQSLNLYTYVRDVPTTNVDLDGHDCYTFGTMPPFTVCWDRSQFGSIRQAESAHEAQHRSDYWHFKSVYVVPWKFEQAGFAAEIPILQHRLDELTNKEATLGLTEDEKQEKQEVQERLDTAKSMVEGPEADRTAERYFYQNNPAYRLFMKDPDADAQKNSNQTKKNEEEKKEKPQPKPKKKKKPKKKAHASYEF